MHAISPDCDRWDVIFPRSADPVAQKLSSPTMDKATKRRKVRKGTRSCWECKRRKVRCVFSSASSAACGVCRGRGLNFVSQEFSDDESPEGRKSYADDRVAHLEAVVQDLVRSVKTGSILASLPASVASLFSSDQSWARDGVTSAPTPHSRVSRNPQSQIDCERLRVSHT
jgi:hypothetical protein